MPSVETLREKLSFGAVVFAFHLVSLVLPFDFDELEGGLREMTDFISTTTSLK